MSSGEHTDDENDRRQEQRAPIELKVEYKRLNTFFYDYTKNISKGGTFIKTDRPLDIGTVFLFRLQVPATTAPIDLRGEVRWVIRPGETPPSTLPADHEPGMGIRFVYASAAERDVFERSVEKMMVGSLGQLIFSRLVGSDGEDDAGRADLEQPGGATAGSGRAGNSDSDRASDSDDPERGDRDK